MRNCIIFGSGFYGKGAYYKLKRYYNILYYVDSNDSLHGMKLYDIDIISVEEMATVFDRVTTDIIICSQAYFTIANQLLDLQINEYYVMLEGFLYHTDDLEVMMPVSLHREEYYKKSPGEKNMLFVQNTACIRTHKIATVMRNRGYKVFLLYTIAPPERNNADFADVYTKVFTAFTAKQMIDFVNGSDFDVVHSSNEPDSLTNLLLLTNKKIVFDTHDMMSLCGYSRLETLTLEYLANTKSEGVMYTSDGVAEIAEKKFNLSNEKIFSLENVILEQLAVDKRHEKLSMQDHKVHCVYEGGVVGSDPLYLRYFENIWKKITDCGIHIHFYSPSDEVYCSNLAQTSEFLHFEGNMGSKELINEMTKYDCGLAVFNVNDGNRVFLETGTANKVYEYLNAGLPVVVGNIKSYIRFVEKYGVGKYLDLDGNISQQISEICKIKIADDFLEKNGLTMDAKGDDLEAFYQKVMGEEAI